MRYKRGTVPARYAWVKTIRKGDVLKSGTGTLRAVREVKHNGASLGKTSVMFSILHCSWTHRPHTTLTGTDLVQFGYRPTGARVRLNKKIDRLILDDARGRKETVYRNGKVVTMHCPLLPGDTKIHCCDVKGVY